MMRSKCASSRSLRALVAAAALAVPLALTTTASADHQFGYRDIDRGSIGSMRIDGRMFRVSSERAWASQTAAAFCRLGYDAWADCDTVVVRTRRGCTPNFRWDGCDYDLCQTWRGDCLVLSLKRIERRPVVVHRTVYSRPHSSVVTRHGGEQSGGYCAPVRRQPIIVTVGPRNDDPDWGRREFRGQQKPAHLDQGWNRSWDRSIDKGFGLRWNWESRDKGNGRKR